MDDAHICMHIESISPPFNGGTLVELKFILSHCHGIEGGEMRVRVPAVDANKYMRGDEFMMRMRRI